jgi:hypothetical protein
MSEMIERVAQAICGDDNPENILGIHRRRARKAIEAMREPTQAMRLAAVAEWSRPDPTDEHESTKVFNAIWRAMIDAALAPS